MATYAKVHEARSMPAACQPDTYPAIYLRSHCFHEFSGFCRPGNNITNAPPNGLEDIRFPHQADFFDLRPKNQHMMKFT